MSIQFKKLKWGVCCGSDNVEVDGHDTLEGRCNGHMISVDGKVAMVEKVQGALSATVGVTEFTDEVQSRKAIYKLETEGYIEIAGRVFQAE